MPLLDHFRPPLTQDLKWESFNTLWVASLVRWLNRTLPRDEFRAMAQVNLGSSVEADVAEFRREPAPSGSRNWAISTLPQVAAPTATLPAVFPDEFEVQVADRLGNLLLAGVIEVVSPANKKEKSERDAFVAKCVSYLRQGVGVVIVDVVTERLANFHNELMQVVGGLNPPLFPTGTATYVAGYRPVRREARNEIDVWSEAAVVGNPVPSVPLALRRGPLVPLDLEGTYNETLTDSGL